MIHIEHQVNIMIGSYLFLVYRLSCLQEAQLVISFHTDILLCVSLAFASYGANVVSPVPLEYPCIYYGSEHAI